MPIEGLLIAFYTIIRKEILRFIIIWPQTLLPPVISTFLYFLIFGSFIGSRIGLIQGIPYIDYIIPGLIMMSIINSAFTNVVSSFYFSKFQREIEELLTSSTPPSIIMAGYVVGGMLRGIIVGVIIYLISLIFATTPIANPLISLAFIFLTSLAFSLAGLLNGIFANKFDDMVIFSTFVLTPLTYLGGIFYYIYDLSPLWQKLSLMNPILYMVDGLRYGFTGITDVSIYISLSILILLCIFLTVIDVILIRRGIGIKH